MFFTANGANRPHLPPLGAMRAVSLFPDRHRMERRGTGRSASPLLLPMQGGNAFVSRKWQSGTRRLCGSLRHASGVRPPGSALCALSADRFQALYTAGGAEQRNLVSRAEPSVPSEGRCPQCGQQPLGGASGTGIRAGRAGALPGYAFRRCGGL